MAVVSDKLTADALAALITTQGKPQLPEAVLALLHTLVRFDSGLCLLYRADSAPMVLAEALAHPARRNDVAAYLAGAYLLDPFRAHAHSIAEPELVRLGDIATGNFTTTDYFRNYYVGSQLVDEINFLIPIAPAQVVAVCLGRSQVLNAFADSELARLRNWLKVLNAVFCHHYQLPQIAQLAYTQSTEIDQHARRQARLSEFGRQRLTKREHEIVQLMLAGISAPEISQALNVSVQTVRVHRRNIYEKLEVSSIGQLFSQALRVVLG